MQLIQWRRDEHKIFRAIVPFMLAHPNNGLLFGQRTEILVERGVTTGARVEIVNFEVREQNYRQRNTAN